MIELDFRLDRQSLKRTDNNVIAANAVEVHKCCFDFDSEWNGLEKSATFSRNGASYTVLIDTDSSCVIPHEVLAGNSREPIKMGVFGVGANDVLMTSTTVNLLVESGASTDGASSEITPTLFEQIMARIAEIEQGEVSPEAIAQAVEDYLTENPIEAGLTEAEVIALITSYVTEHIEDLKGADGDDGKSAYQIAVDNGFVGTESEWLESLHGTNGNDGTDGVTPTITATATVDNTSGTPSVNVTKSGTDENPSFAFAFTGLKGADGSGSETGLNDNVKTALLQIAEKVAYVDSNGQSYYNALYNALYNRSPVSINAVYTQGGTVYSGSDLEILRNDLVVTATYADSTTEVVTNYTLSGSLTEGTSTITVTLGECTDTFTVTVTALIPYITSGLTHYYDGINNTGTGHSASISSWTDLVGTDNLIMNNSSYSTWDSNALVFSGNGGQRLLGTNTAEAIGNSTIEVVIAPDNTQPQVASTVFIGFAVNTDSLGTISVYNDNTFKVHGKKSYSYQNTENELSALHHVAGTYSSSAVLGAYGNGTAASLSSNQHSLAFRDTTTMLVGQCGIADSEAPYGYPYKGKVYAIRVYDRVLTAEEIAQNYAIDVERFNL